MVWRVPRMWDGGECWIIGGGPSVPQQFGIPDDVVRSVIEKRATPSVYSPYLEAIHNKHAIGINVAYLIGDWIDMVFFGDKKFLLTNRDGLARFPGLKVTCHPRVNAPQYGWIKYLEKDRRHTKGISSNPATVSWNGNSGAAAISVAANAGAKRIVLLGFDMKLDETQQQHWHSLYKKVFIDVPKPVGKGVVTKKPPFSRHLLGFPVIAADARRRGIEILNASPDSAIKDFRKVSVKELLCDEK